MTGVKAKYHISLKVWKDYKAWLFSAFEPSILIAAGAALYFILFSDEYSGICKYGTRFGTAGEVQVHNPIFFAFACILLSAVLIPIQLLELGEEIGWRGWLLGFQVEKYGEKKAVIINGVEWGVSHFPLIYFGFNYSLKNPGAPWTNMAMMCLICVVLGILFSYVTIRTGNCMYSAIMHGAVNVIGEIPVFLTYDMESNLLDPNPTGLIGVSFLTIFAVVVLLKMKSSAKSNPPQ